MFFGAPYQLVKLCSGMIEAGRTYVSANKLFVNGIKDLSQQCKKEEMISVRRSYSGFKSRLASLDPRRNVSPRRMPTHLSLLGHSSDSPHEQLQQSNINIIVQTHSSSCCKHERSDRTLTGDVYADSLRGCKQRNMKPALYFSLAKHLDWISCQYVCRPGCQALSLQNKYFIHLSIAPKCIL